MDAAVAELKSQMMNVGLPLTSPLLIGKRSQRIDHIFELCLHSLSHDRELGILDCSHGGHGIDRGYLHHSVSHVLHDDVAGKHRADLILT